VSPRTETRRDRQGFFGTEEAIARNVKDGRLDVALDKYEEYVRMRHAKPLPPWAQIEIASELFRRKDYEAALKAYRRYLADHPAGMDAAEAKFRLGMILSRHRKEYFRAREYLLQASMEHTDDQTIAFARKELKRIEGFL
jgi:outer membrane protein assembly factor BamD (BamD/ComL family)